MAHGLRTRILLSTLSLSLLSVGCTINSTTINEAPKTPEKKVEKPKDSKAAPVKDKPKTPEKPKDSKPSKPAPPKPEPKPQPTPEPKPDPKPEEPKAETPKPPVVTPPKDQGPAVPVESNGAASRLAVPIRVPLEKLLDEIDRLLPKTESQGWTAATGKNDSPFIETKYEAWRDPVTGSFKGDTLNLVIPLRFAALVRAKVKNPLGGDWITLTDGETWGTKARPQRMKINVAIQIGLDGDWSVKSVSKLGKIEHGAAPDGEACTKGVLKVCTPKKSLTGQVNEQIDKRLRDKIVPALKKADKEVAKTLDAKKHVETLWNALGTPVLLHKAKAKGCEPKTSAVCASDLWLQFSPEALGVSELGIHGDDVGIDIALEGKLKTTSGKKPKVSEKALPKPKKLDSSGKFELSTTLSVPRALVEDETYAAYGGLIPSEMRAKFSLSSVGVAFEAGEKVTVTLSTAGENSGKVTLKGKVTLDAKKAAVRFSDLSIDETSRLLLVKAGIDANQFLAKLEGAQIFAPGRGTEFLEDAITSGLVKNLGGQLELRGKWDDATLVRIRTDDKDLTIEVRLAGKLAAEYSP